MKHDHPDYPDDLDDTFTALIALFRYRPTLVPANAIAAAAKLLISTEVKEGGPYRTWLLSPLSTTVKNDPDAVINSTIGYFLSLQGVSSPGIEKYITDAVSNKECLSVYYPGIHQATYFISRYLGAKTILPAYSPFITPLESALHISSCFNAGQSEKITPSIINDLISNINKYGWQPYPFCMDPAKDHKPYYAGASALTAAFVAEALMRYLHFISSSLHTAPSHLPAANDTALPHDQFHRHIQYSAIQACDALPEEIKSIAIDKITNTSNRIVTAPSYDMQKSLDKKRAKLPQNITKKAALAGLYGWMAYDIYDDIIDKETNTPSLLLPVADYFSKKLKNIYTDLSARFPDAPIQTLFTTTIKIMNDANLWEITYCKSSNNNLCLPEMLPDYGNHEILADRSIGYAMGPLAQLLISGYAADSSEYRSTESLLRHYLIARQLHDDAHDWENDLLRGSINSICAPLIDNYRTRFPKHAHTAVAKIIYPLREFFWKKTINRTVALIHTHIKDARTARDGCELLRETGFMEDALFKLEHGATKALTERDCALEFLENF